MKKNIFSFLALALVFAGCVRTAGFDRNRVRAAGTLSKSRRRITVIKDRALKDAAGSETRNADEATICDLRKSGPAGPDDAAEWCTRKRMQEEWYRRGSKAFVSSGRFNLP